MAHYRFFSWPNSHLFSRTDIPLLKPRTAQKLSTTSSSSPAPHLHATPNALSHRLPRLTPLRTQTKIIFRNSAAHDSKTPMQQKRRTSAPHGVTVTHKPVSQNLQRGNSCVSFTTEFRNLAMEKLAKPHSSHLPQHHP
ncbi:hypothetical protein M758_1G249700 [Ceratodon purpureus]|nr:hypothetical protein M758_1G249700 [Ceratodon purpureus]